MPPRIMFGMHFGKPWSEVPQDYLDWMLKGPFDSDKKLKWN